MSQREVGQNTESDSMTIDRQLEAIGGLGMNQIPISELFVSIQGEGVFQGVPSVFVRTAVCNLSCVWCDTAYTWKEELLKESDVLKLHPEDLVDMIHTIIGKRKVRNLVITGGEPMIWQMRMLDVVKNLNGEGFTIEVETNGTVMPSLEFSKYITHFNVSPKLNNNGSDPASRRVVKKALSAFADLARQGKAYFKFVIINNQDVEELEKVFVLPFDIPYSSVILMPEGTTPDVLSKRLAGLIEISKRTGYRITDRLQIHVYGNMRGV